MLDKLKLLLNLLSLPPYSLEYSSLQLQLKQTTQFLQIQSRAQLLQILARAQHLHPTMTPSKLMTDWDSMMIATTKSERKTKA